MRIVTENFEMGTKLIEKTNIGTVSKDETAIAKLRAGIVGAGLMGKWHAHALKKVGGTVVTIADFDTKKAEQLAAQYPNSKVFANVEEMLSSQDVDVLHVCSPIGSHELIAQSAIKSGVHLLIEKPVAATAKVTTELYDLAEKNNTLLCPVHQFVFQDGVKKAEKLLPQIGQLVHLEARICSAGGDGFDEKQITQIAADILPHPLSLMQKFLGNKLSDFEWDTLHPSHGELRVFGQKEKKASLSIFISMNSRPTINSFHLFGLNGTIHIDLFHGFAIIEPGKTSKFRKVLYPFNSAARNFSAATGNLVKRILRNESAYPGLRQLIREFYGAIKDDASLPITPAEAIAVAEIRDLLMSRAGIAQ